MSIDARRKWRPLPLDYLGLDADSGRKVRVGQSSGGFGGEVGGVQEGEEDAAEGGFAAGGVVPLLQGVDAAAMASGADGDGGDAERERDVGVGGAEAGFGAEGEVAVDGAEGGEEGGVVGEGAGGTVSDGFDGESWRWR